MSEEFRELLEFVFRCCSSLDFNASTRNRLFCCLGWICLRRGFRLNWFILGRFKRRIGWKTFILSRSNSLLRFLFSLSNFQFQRFHRSTSLHRIRDGEHSWQSIQYFCRLLTDGLLIILPSYSYRKITMNKERKMCRNIFLSNQITTITDMRHPESNI